MNKLRLITGVFSFYNVAWLNFQSNLCAILCSSHCLMMKQPNNPLHGITLAQIMEELTEAYSWDYLANQININCFKKDPSIKSSLKFLRKTPWARKKVEELYLWTLKKNEDQP